MVADAPDPRIRLGEVGQHQAAHHEVYAAWQQARRIPVIEVVMQVARIGQRLTPGGPQRFFRKVETGDIEPETVQLKSEGTVAAASIDGDPATAAETVAREAHEFRVGDRTEALAVSLP
ncbi:hypothetical protein T261_8461 [Streptomyces lydicus]|nr:hypothetical protein T261_8461 [Streptomyces lydicus]